MTIQSSLKSLTSKVISLSFRALDITQSILQCGRTTIIDTRDISPSDLINLFYSTLYELEVEKSLVRMMVDAIQKEASARMSAKKRPQGSNDG